MAAPLESPPPSPEAILAERLAAARGDRSVSEIARQLGTHRTQVSRMLHEQRGASTVLSWVRLARALGIRDLDELVRGLDI